jgi:hypothetical protein
LSILDIRNMMGLTKEEKENVVLDLYYNQGKTWDSNPLIMDGDSIALKSPKRASQTRMRDNVCHGKS